jgi:hypothetical protein
LLLVVGLSGLACPVVPCACVPPPAAGRVYGQVLAAGTGLPGATIHLRVFTDTTCASAVSPAATPNSVVTGAGGAFAVTVYATPVRDTMCVGLTALRPVAAGIDSITRFARQVSFLSAIAVDSTAVSLAFP